MKNICEFAGFSGAAGIIALFLFFAMLVGVSRLPKKKYTFAGRVLIGSGSGTIFGLMVWFFKDKLDVGIDGWMQLIAHGYLNLLAVLVIPMVFLASVRLVIRTPEEKQVSELTKWKKRVNTIMLIISAAVAVVFGIVFRVGAIPGQEMVVFEWNDGIALTEQLLQIVPSGIGTDCIKANVIGICIMGIFVGIAARRMSGKYMDTVRPVFELTEAAFSVGTSVCKNMISYKPVGTAAIMAVLTAKYGIAVVLMIAKMLLVLTLSAIVMLFIQLLFCMCSGVSPIAFLKAGKIAMVKALKTRSGAGCLPEAQKALEDLGLNREITDVVSSYAINSGMQGCAALFPAMAAVFAAGISGITMTPSVICVMILGIAIVSYGITDIPGTATFAEFSAVMGSGMQSAVPGLGAMVAIDPIGDVPRTLINVTGCMVNAIIVERRLRK